jgi:hypothetical protein
MRQSTWNPVRKKMLYVIFLFATFWKKRYPENKRISQTDGTVQKQRTRNENANGGTTTRIRTVTLPPELFKVNTTTLCCFRHL